MIHKRYCSKSIEPDTKCDCKAGFRNDLSALFRKARQYGRISITQLDDGRICASISFNTIVHTELKARSGFNHETPEEALEKAITVAEQIVESMTIQSSELRKLKGEAS